MSDKYVAFLHGKIVAICEAILAEKIGIIAGSRILVSLHFDLFTENDSDFSIFRVVDSDTDHLPVDFERKNWSPEALQRKDIEIAESEEFYKNQVFDACRELTKRFKLKNNSFLLFELLIKIFMRAQKYQS